METLPIDCPTWASLLYEKSFMTRELAKSPYETKRFKSYAAATVKTATKNSLQQPNDFPAAQSTMSQTAHQLQSSNHNIPPTATTATTTNVSLLTPMTPAPQMQTQTQNAQPVPVSPVLADTEA